MKIEAMQLRQFSAFENADLSFCPGINVLIGANATGKTHLLKLLYATCAGIPKRAAMPPKRGPSFDDRLAMKLINVFRPDGEELSHLIRQGAKSSSISLSWGLTRLSFQIAPNGWVTSKDTKFKDEARAVFIPSREVLSMFRGFVPAYEEQELAFDETYYDICMALMRNPLRIRLLEWVKLVGELQASIGGSVIFTGTDFYLKAPGERGKGREVQLVSEGYRRIAMLAHLVNNGAVGRNGILFWDEPESSLNPKLVTLMALVLRRIAAMNVQVFVATHDYLLTSELSLAVEYKTAPAVPTRFFCLSRAQPNEPVSIESGDKLADLEHNPIIAEFVAHYDRELQLFYKDTPKNA